jgi:hypothetical protein
VEIARWFLDVLTMLSAGGRNMVACQLRGGCQLMNLRYISVLAFALLCLWSGGVFADEILYDNAKAIRLLDRDIVSPTEKMSHFKEPFEKALGLVDENGLEKLSDYDIEDFYEIAMTLSFYSNGPRYTKQMRRAFDEMERRHLATHRMGQRMRDQYVASRMFVDANNFAESRPDLKLKRIPEIETNRKTTNLPSLLRLSSDGKTLTHESFNLGNEARVVVVGSPWCSFSQAASAAIANDSELSSLMNVHSTWILGQSMIPDFYDIKKWNDTFPGRPLFVVNKNDEWPWIPAWETPGFYFLEHGKIVTSVVGWPGPEQKTKLLKGFETIGIPVN